MSFARQEQRLILSDLSDAEGIVDRPRHPDKRHHELSKAHERADNDGGSAHIEDRVHPLGRRDRDPIRDRDPLHVSDIETSLAAQYPTG